MSKFGRKPIQLGSASISLDGFLVKYKGNKGSGEYLLPDTLLPYMENSLLFIKPAGEEKKFRNNAQWGLHRALLSNAIKGADSGFEKQIKIKGLGFKAQAQGKTLIFSLGFSHKKTYDVPEEVTVEIDKTGQLLTCKSNKKDVLGQVCSDIRSLRPPEPYKGVGIQYGDEVVRIKPGKAKS